MKTKTIFREFSDGEIIAVFPQEPWDVDGIYCSSYMHIGQHGAADISICSNKTTKPASTDKCQDLIKELENIGYNLDIRKRISYKDDMARKLKAKTISPAL